MGVAELVFLRGGTDVLQLRVERAEICIGSHPTNDVVVPDASVPDVAAVLIDRGAQRFLLRDLTGGLLQLNGEKLENEEEELAGGDVIHIGPHALRFSLREEPTTHRGRPGHTAVLGQAPKSAVSATLTFEGTRFELSGARPFNVGSEEDNDLVLDDEFVSSFHCRLICREGRWFVLDLDSTNGTEVNGLAVREAELPTRALLKLGRAVLKFDALPDAGSTEDAGRFHGMIARSEPMVRVSALTRRLAAAREPVLVVGESGSGKELIARALHDLSGRKPFLALNCGALSSGVIESELFGYVKGAFTGAAGDKAGAFEATNGGTLFLDEIGELPLDLQPKLLRVLESSVVRRVGGTKEIAVDTRVVAATHRNLDELVAEGSFREDLFHRLFVLSIRLPPLRDRREDILPLARSFLETQAPGRGLSLAKDAEAALLEYSWPGNIRELRNVIVRAILMTDGPVLAATDLQFSRDAFSKPTGDARVSVRRLEADERQRMIAALEKAEGNRAEAARALGISKSTFHDRLRRYQINLGPGKER